MRGSAGWRMRHPGQAIMIAWRTSCKSGGSAPRRQSLPLVAPSRGDPLGTCCAALPHVVTGALESRSRVRQYRAAQPVRRERSECHPENPAASMVV